MPDIKDSVGELTAQNKTHDVALVQAMLKLIKNTKGTAYMASDYSGTYNVDTKNAITNFQKDHKLIPADAKAAKLIKDKLGFITKNGVTLKQINKLLPATHKTMTIIQDTRTVYLEGDAKLAKTNANSILNDATLDATFRGNVSKLVKEMYSQYKIVIQTTPTGRRRTFAKQATILPPASFAGPGESNHNFGHAVDIGFRNLPWVKGDGTIHKDTYWLHALEKASNAKARAFWDTRDALAKGHKLHALNFERIHLQSYNHKTASSVRSLAALLNLAGAMKWQGVPIVKNSKYKSSLGHAKGLFDVGTARQIWAEKATVTKAMLAKATGTPVTKITQKDITKMKKSLKAEFEAAENKWSKWKPVP